MIPSAFILSALIAFGVHKAIKSFWLASLASTLISFHFVWWIWDSHIGKRLLDYRGIAVDKDFQIVMAAIAAVSLFTSIIVVGLMKRKKI